jgi:hypothetical protein
MNPLVENIEQFYVMPGIGVVEVGQVIMVPKHNVINVLGSNTGVVCESPTGVVVLRNNGPIIECSHANMVGVRYQCVAGWKSRDSK